MVEAFSLSQSFTSRRSLGFLLRRAYQLLEPIAETVFSGRDLTLAQWIALKEIDRGEVTTGSQVACMLGHSTGATTRMIDQLECRGFLTRIRLPGDRRVVTLAVTDEGRRAVLEMVPGMTALWQELLQDLSDQESDMLLTLLGRVVDRLECNASEVR